MEGCRRTTEMIADNQAMPDHRLVYGARSTVTVGGFGAYRKIDLDEASMATDTIAFVRCDRRKLASHHD